MLTVEVAASREYCREIIPDDRTSISVSGQSRGISGSSGMSRSACIDDGKNVDKIPK